jgi:hypothetical protein
VPPVKQGESERFRQLGGKRTPDTRLTARFCRFGGNVRPMREQSGQIVLVFTKTLEWRCLDQIRAQIQELRVADLPHRASATGGYG